ncbi:hypothetical protein [Yinghuangia sp. YIM S10712]|uniref:hypothetical protein n=1 Tax=Yinghuangia sp. YIM S10712 TaxID=3436930 RepID=UPI003F53245B
MQSYLLADEVEKYEKAYKQPLVEMISYALWITVFICALGLIIAAAKIVVGYLEGNPRREVFGVFWVMAGCLLATSATSIATELLF